MQVRKKFNEADNDANRLRFRMCPNGPKGPQGPAGEAGQPVSILHVMEGLEYFSHDCVLRDFLEILDLWENLVNQVNLVRVDHQVPPDQPDLTASQDQKDQSVLPALAEEKANQDRKVNHGPWSIGPAKLSTLELTEILFQALLDNADLLELQVNLVPLVRLANLAKKEPTALQDYQDLLDLRVLPEFRVQLDLLVRTLSTVLVQSELETSKPNQDQSIDPSAFLSLPNLVSILFL